MARESCNLDKEEAEILKPSSPSSSSPSPPPPAAIAPPSLFLKPSQELPSHGEERPEAATADPTAAAAPCDEGKTSQEEEEFQTPVRFTNRCSRCRKRVGLTGFRCRCGDLFCCRHRYSDAHDCSFDYKAAGREEISKANPVVRAAKIIKI